MTDGKYDGIESLTSDLFTAKTEILLQRVIDRMQHHESEISLLRKSQEDELNATNQNIQCLKEKIDSIENSINIPGVSTNVGEGVALNRRSLARALNLVSMKVDLSEWRLSIDIQNKELLDTAKKLQKDLANNSSVHKLTEACGALNKRVDVLSDDMRNKVDNSLFKTISSEANSICQYTKSMEHVEEDLKKIEEVVHSNKNKMSGQADVSQLLSNSIRKLEDKIADQQTIYDITVIRSELEEISKKLANKASSCSVFKLERENQELQREINVLRKNSSTLYTANESLAKHMSGRIDETYKREEVHKLISKLVEKDDFFGTILKITEEIDSKAREESITMLTKCLDKICADHVITRKKVDLAAQFVEWYEYKDERYEHSIRQDKTVDTKN